ncbi:MAG: PorT family protein [Bacteroidales bacterium]|nr:PorT family protein [Bacteroidales bacterium]
MQRPAVILFLFLLNAGLHAQVERPRNLPAFDYKTLHWGFTVGLNSMDFAVNRNLAAPGYVRADVIGFQPAGFQVNVVSDLRLSDFWNLRFLPGLNLGSRQVMYFDPDTWERVLLPSPGDDTNPYAMTVQSSFLDFPLLLKYRSVRVNNYRPYVIGGVSYRLDMSARGVRGSFDSGSDNLILLKKSDLYLEVGFGIDQYLKYFKYSTELKLAMGLRNMIVEDAFKDNDKQYVESINGLRSFLVMLNFHFE